jgi:two-component system NtrC family sensor kinase
VTPSPGAWTSSSAGVALAADDALRLLQAVPGVLLLVRDGLVARRHVPARCESRALADWALQLEELPGALSEVVAAARRTRGVVSEVTLSAGLVTRVNAVLVSDDEVALSVSDISEQRHVEEQVLAAERNRLEAQSLAQRAATERLSALGTLAAGVAHEINNPLTWVSSSLEFVKQELTALAPGSEALDALAEAEEGVARIGAIVRDMRVLARGGGSQPLEPTPLLPVLRAAVQATAGVFRERAAVVVHAEHALDAMAREGGLVQVLVNLLVNAAQTLPHGDAHGNRVDVRLTGPENGWVELEVKDTGAGMDEKTLARAFDPFFTTRDVNAGVGLGLAVSRSLVEGMGGHLDLESRPGHGTTARIRLVSAAKR